LKPTTMSNGKTVLGILAGLAAGVAIGMLLAPRSGKETRSMLRNKGKKAMDDLEDLLDHGYEKWKEARNTVVERANMTKTDLKDFLAFMAAEGADLKARVAQDLRGSTKKATDPGMDQPSRN
nr:YtxH domain-containing protein [Flavobacteriales bacterium]